MELEGQPLLLDPAEVSGFIEQIGRNTDYNLCAEEVLAENFVMLVTGEEDVPSPVVLTTPKSQLRNCTS